MINQGEVRIIKSVLGLLRTVYDNNSLFWPILIFDQIPQDLLKTTRQNFTKNPFDAVVHKTVSETDYNISDSSLQNCQFSMCPTSQRIFLSFWKVAWVFLSILIIFLEWKWQMNIWNNKSECQFLMINEYHHSKLNQVWITSLFLN